VLPEFGRELVEVDGVPSNKLIAAVPTHVDLAALLHGNLVQPQRPSECTVSSKQLRFLIELFGVFERQLRAPKNLLKK
jgi:hypothetical protein